MRIGRPSMGETRARLARLRVLRPRWPDVQALRERVVRRGARGELDARELETVRREMRECLESRGGEVSARTRAAELERLYVDLAPEGRAQFVALLATEFGVDTEALVGAARKVADARVPEERERAIREMKATLEAPWLTLLRQFNAVPSGTAFLVELRADLLQFERENEELGPLEQDLRSLLASWFDVGFLELRRITWDSPASLLEKLARSEAVHAVASWDDLKNRLDVDRRVFAFFHPGMPDVPIIFVEVALVSGLAGAIEPVLDAEAPLIDPDRADTAIFYSISNANPGLAGIAFGGFLIKQVIDALVAEFAQLRTFATLSPIPGFRSWLDQQLADRNADLLLAEERRSLEAATHGADFTSTLASTEFPVQPELAAALRGPLLRLCAEYLLAAKRSDGRALDRVANFHLANGARVERLNWLADTSERALRDSAGIMVNYLYSLSDIEANHEAYTGEGVVVASSTVTRLAREGKA